MTSTRREFLIQAGRCGACLPLGWALKPFLLRSLEQASLGEPRADRILVVVQLAGGNDGLNTLIPYADDDYYKNRRVIGIRKDSVLKLDEHLALHPSMKALRGLYDEGRLAVVQGVGYPNPNRSHFRSSDIWSSAVVEQEDTRSGWLGRAVDRLDKAEETVPAIAAGETNLPLTLVGRNGRAVSILSLESFRLQANGADASLRKSTLRALASNSSKNDSNLDFLRRSSQLAYRCSERLEKLESLPASGSEIGKRLQLVAQLIQADLGTRVYHVSLGGFDTHADQLPGHATLLTQLSDAVAAFYKKLESDGLADRVLLMTVSEFGRRLSENASRGTDHGTAAPVFVVGKPARGGIYGARPSLIDLQDGDIKHSVDFREVYATVLENWFGWDSKQVLDDEFKRLKFV